MVHVVALTRAPRVALPGGYREVGSAVAAPIESWLGPLASLLGMTAYDVRLRVAGSPPRVVARTGEPEASALLARLRALGWGAVAVDPDGLLGAHASPPARVFLREDGVLLEPQGRTLPFADLTLLVRATIEQELATETVRATPSNLDGITRHNHERVRAHALYLSTREDARGVRLIEGTLAFPELAGSTGRERFEGFVAGLRARAPHARFHDRMVAEPRRRTTYRPLFVDARQRGALQGNLEETDRAAWLLALALAQRQLE